MKDKCDKYNYYVAYEDKGPSGPCGQTVENTAPWRKLYIFGNESDAREFVDSVYLWRRIAPKIIGFWSDSVYWNNIIDKR